MNNNTPAPTFDDLEQLDSILDRILPSAGRRLTDTWRHWLESGRPDVGNWSPDRQRILEIAAGRERSKR
jgi:hypothetical protein